MDTIKDMIVVHLTEMALTIAEWKKELIADHKKIWNNRLLLLVVLCKSDEISC